MADAGTLYTAFKDALVDLLEGLNDGAETPSYYFGTNNVLFGNQEKYHTKDMAVLLAPRIPSPPKEFHHFHLEFDQPAIFISQKDTSALSIAHCIGAYGACVTALQSDRTLSKTVAECNLISFEPYSSDQYVQQVYMAIFRVRIRLLPG